jgi:hypothetical protein
MAKRGLHGEECHRHQEIECLQDMVNGDTMCEGSPTEAHPVTNEVFRGVVTAGEVCDQRLDDSTGIGQLQRVALILLIEKQRAPGSRSPTLGEICRLLPKQWEDAGLHSVGA